ncbi:uncharacterized protein LOC115587596 isoform X2 [Sparus aurata]|uniref:uncharacterized protein LOC115587596 isoform X2 n=1 Tax=Sparus aurata TaxID=8175 RepID=UPI0011C18CBD|nr:uncharacterized protein LOC115587596 isoform X2 [Sparus aurata]
MSGSSVNIFTIFTIHLSFILHPSNGFKVIQPHSQTVNSDRVASISCEHTANVTSVEDIRLFGIPPTSDPKKLLCQKGDKDQCENIIMDLESPNKCLFIIFNIGPEAMSMKYECEFTVKENDVDLTKTGTPTTLLPGDKEVVFTAHPSPPTPQSDHLRWILIGLLALILVYSCIITSFYIRMRLTNGGPENSTYVIMRKAPLPRNPAFDVYCG